MMGTTTHIYYKVISLTLVGVYVQNDGDYDGNS